MKIIEDRGSTRIYQHVHFTDLVVSPGPGAGPQVVPIVEYLVVAAPEVIITHNTDSALVHAGT